MITLQVMTFYYFQFDTPEDVPPLISLLNTVNDAYVGIPTYFVDVDSVSMRIIVKIEEEDYFKHFSNDDYKDYRDDSNDGIEEEHVRKMQEIDVIARKLLETYLHVINEWNYSVNAYKNELEQLRNK